MTLGPEKSGKLLNVILLNGIWANQKPEPVVFRWLRAHATFDVTFFPAFVGVPDVISGLLSIRYLCVYACLLCCAHGITIYA